VGYEAMMSVREELAASNFGGPTLKVEAIEASETAANFYHNWDNRVHNDCRKDFRSDTVDLSWQIIQHVRGI
jgi:hypothetical protein